MNLSMDLDALIDGLTHCIVHQRMLEDGCIGCPYYEVHRSGNCWPSLFKDAREAAEEVKRIQSLREPVEVVRCKDCVHRGHFRGNIGPMYPDDVCPGQCADFFYSWLPPDDWYCPNGERKQSGGDANAEAKAPV